MDKEIEQLADFKAKIEEKIKAWEEREKRRGENEFHRAIVDMEAWQKQREASQVAKYKQLEVEVESFKQLKLEKVRKEEAQMQKTLEVKKAAIEARRQKHNLDVETKAAFYRSTNTRPSSCFGICRD